MHDSTSAPIVVGYDGSEHGAAALRWAVEEARLRAAPLRVVHVWHPAFVEGFPYTGTPHDPFTPERDAREMTDAAIAAAVPAGDVEIDVEVVCGSPASTLLERSKDAAMLVVGSRGLGGLRGALLGSVSQQLAHHATPPLVIIRP